MDPWIDLSSGAAGIVTAMGMGTVFLCLTLLYIITRLLGATMLAVGRRAAARSASAETSPAVDTRSDSSQTSTASDGEDAAAAKQSIAAAITLALSRHRAVRARAAASGSGSNDAWKIAGRIEMLRGG